MARTVANILSLNHEEAMDFFMKSEQPNGYRLFCCFDKVEDEDPYIDGPF